MPPGEAQAQVIRREDSHTSTTRGRQLAGLMLLAAWFGLVTGLGEVFIQNIMGFLANKQIDINQQSAWMTPVADLLIFTIIGLLLFLLARRLPKLISPRAVAFVFSFLGFLSLLFRISWLASYAALPLAAGLAVQVSRYIAARDSKWPGKSLVAGRYHYIKNGEGREMLYDIENDPFEKQDLAQTEEGRRVCERFRNHLDTIFASNRRSN